jgi:tetratricopeptide (TPR) repeat protein
LELFEAVNERKGIARVFRSIGLVYWQKSDYDAAIMCYKKALKISEEVGDMLGSAKSENNMGIVYDLKGDYEAAMTWYQKSLQISEKLGEKLNMSNVVINIGENYRLQGNYDAAMTYLKRALQIKEELGDRLYIALALGNIGLVYKAKGDCDRAMTYYDRAIGILRELDNKYALSCYLINKAETLFSLQQYAEAQVLNAEGLQIAKEIGSEEFILQGNVLSAKIDFTLDNEDAPKRLYHMLQQPQDDADSATLHYELWKMIHNEEHRQTALDLYQTLYERTPNSGYKTRIEEMSKNSS